MIPHAASFEGSRAAQLVYNAGQPVAQWLARSGLNCAPTGNQTKSPEAAAADEDDEDDDAKTRHESDAAQIAIPRLTSGLAQTTPPMGQQTNKLEIRERSEEKIAAAELRLRLGSRTRGAPLSRHFGLRSRWKPLSREI